MRNRIRQPLVGFFLWLSIFPAALVGGIVAAAEYSNVFHVAPGGSDGNPGTRELPLQTLEEARLRVRNYKSTFGIGPGGIAVYLHDGTWFRSSTFDLSEEDGGDADRPVVWRSMPGAAVRLVGSIEIDPAWFAPVTSSDAEWGLLPVEARGQVLRAALAGRGISDYGQLRVRGNGDRATGALELFVDGVPMPLARWPDPDQHTGQSSEDTTLSLYGSSVPDVSGSWTKFGTRDGVNAYVRDDPVGGIAYYLHRLTWEYAGNWHTAWFISTEDDGYPSDDDPWWSLYSPDLGSFEPNEDAGAAGNPTTLDPAAIFHGFAAIESALSDTQFTMANTRLSRWTGASDLWFFGFWRYHWADTHVAAASINPSTRTITLAIEPGYGIADGMPFFAENLLEEISRPGEWYLDRASGVLYFWPDGEIGQKEIMVSMLEEPLLEVRNAEHLRFEGLSFGMGRNDLAVVENSSDVLFDRCRFFGAGNDGLRMTGERLGVRRSEIVDTGDRGVALTGGVRSSLEPGNNVVENTEIHRVGRWSWTYMPGIHLTGVGNLAAHNHVYDAPHSAILFRGNQHLIEYNEINDVCLWSSDAGAIYSGRRWGWRGNRIEFNYVHDVDSPFTGAGEHGVYLDDCLSGIRVFGNLFVDISGHAMMHGGGRDDLFENNIAVRCGTALHTDARGYEWIKNDNSDWDLRRRLHDDGVQYQSEPWCSTWPELCVIPDDTIPVGSHWRGPEGSVFSGNLGWDNDNFIADGNWDGVTALDKFSEIEDNIEDADPRFRNEDAGDYRLAPDSPALAISGFVDLPFPQMGIVDGLSPIFEDGFEWGDASRWQP